MITSVSALVRVITVAEGLTVVRRNLTVTAVQEATVNHPVERTLALREVRFVDHAVKSITNEVKTCFTPTNFLIIALSLPRISELKKKTRTLGSKVHNKRYN